MTFRNIAAKAVQYGVKWNIIKLTFALGAVFGMLFMAILMTSAKALGALLGVVQ